MRITPHLLTLALTLGACGGGSDDPAALADSAVAALNSSDYQTAYDDFGKALELIGGNSGHAQFKRAAVGQIQAQVHLDAEQARKSFLELAQKQSGVITDRDYSDIAGRLASARAFEDAIYVMDAGLKAHIESPVLAKLKESIVKQSKESGDPAALAALEGLGYAGGD